MTFGVSCFAPTSDRVCGTKGNASRYVGAGGSKAFARNRTQRSVPWSMPWSISGQRGALGASIMFARSGSTNRRLSKTHRDRPRLHRRIKASRYTTLAAEHQLFLETVIVFGAADRPLRHQQRTYGADPRNPLLRSAHICPRPTAW